MTEQEMTAMLQVTDAMKPHFKIAGILAAICLVFDTWLSAKFGWSISLDMAGIYGAISLASGTLLVIAVWFYLQGFKPFAGVLCGAWVIAFAFNVWSNIGVSTANRMADVQAANLKKVTHADTANTRADAENKVKFLEARRIELAEDMRKLTQTKVGDWGVTVAPSKPEDLDAMIAAKELEAANEAKRVKCGRLCEARNLEVAHLKKVRGLAQSIADNEKQHTAAVQGVKNAREVLAKTDKGISHAANQSSLYGKLIRVAQGGSFSGDVSDDELANANEGTGIATAIVLAVLSAALTLVTAIPALYGSVPPARASQPSHAGIIPTRTLNLGAGPAGLALIKAA